MWSDPRKYGIVGACIEKARSDAGLTQVQLARKLRKPQSFISSIESGQRRLDLVELVTLADAMNADLADLSASIFAALRGKPAPRKGKP